MWPQIAFNVDCGYLEGLVRGFKSGILKQTGKGDENVKWIVVCEPLAPSLRILRVCLIRRTLYPLPYYFSYFSFSEYLSIFSLPFWMFSLRIGYILSALCIDNRLFEFGTMRNSGGFEVALGVDWLRQLLGQRSWPTFRQHNRRQTQGKTRRRVPTHEESGNLVHPARIGVGHRVLAISIDEWYIVEWWIWRDNPSSRP